MEIPVLRAKWGIRAALALAGLLLVWGGYQLYLSFSEVDPQVLLSDALTKTTGVQSFRFKTSSVMYVDGRKEVLSRIDGEKAGKRLHIKGEMVNTGVELYQVENKTYLRDYLGDNWMVVEDNDLEKSQLLMSELNPLAYFSIKDSMDLKAVDTEKVNGKKCVKLELRPDIDNPWLEVLWTDFHYTLWVDKSQRMIRKAVLKATEKADPQTRLEVTIEFRDFNEEIIIKTPKVKKNIYSGSLLP